MCGNLLAVPSGAQQPISVGVIVVELGETHGGVCVEAWAIAANARLSALVVVWRLESEAFAEHSDIVAVLLTQLVAGVIPQGEFRTFASNREAGDRTHPRQILAREQERRSHAPVVESPVAQGLIKMKVHPTAVAVMHHEVPRPISGPRVKPIDSFVGEGRDKPFELDRINPDVEI